MESIQEAAIFIKDGMVRAFLIEKEEDVLRVSNNLTVAMTIFIGLLCGIYKPINRKSWLIFLALAILVDIGVFLLYFSINVPGEITWDTFRPALIGAAPGMGITGIFAFLCVSILYMLFYFGGAIKNANDGNDGVDDDEDLFKPPPLKEECPLCLLPFPNDANRTHYYPCCGKSICNGCILKKDAILETTNVKRAVRDPPQPPLEKSCAFCRAPLDVTCEVALQQLEKRMALDDADAFTCRADIYYEGKYGLTRDVEKACELYLCAVDLGSAYACFKIGSEYSEFHSGGQFGFGKNRSREIHYFKLAAKRGDVSSRFLLGTFAFEKGNIKVAVKHWMISASAGHDESLELIGQMFRAKKATKDQYEEAIRAKHEAKKEMTSDERDMAKKVYDAGMDMSVLSEKERNALFGIRQGGNTSSS